VILLSRKTLSIQRFHSDKKGITVSPDAISPDGEGVNHLSKTIADILKSTITSFQADLKENSTALKDLHNVVIRLEGSMHHPPCPQFIGLERETEARFTAIRADLDRETAALHKDLKEGFASIRKGMETHKLDHKTEEAEKKVEKAQEIKDMKRFYGYIVAGVSIPIILGILGAALAWVTR